MFEKALPLIGVILGSLISFGSAYFTNKHAEKRELAAFKRNEKLAKIDRLRRICGVIISTLNLVQIVKNMNEEDKKKSYTTGEIKDAVFQLHAAIHELELEMPQDMALKYFELTKEKTRFEWKLKALTTLFRNEILSLEQEIVS